jgi:hypothetical protein
VDSCLSESVFRPLAVFKVGQYQGRKRIENSGFNVEVSDADFANLDRQIDDAIRFLKEHVDELRRLSTFPGVEKMWLAFAIEDREAPFQTDCLPAKLLQLAGSLGMDISLSRYPGDGRSGS